MSRPTAKTFTDDNLIAQFQKLGIYSVINLQMLGEHESCGPQLLPSGFTYNPEILMQNGRKLAVHCHAGLGRTGVVIAAFMIWANHCSYSEAINRVRSARPKSIQSKGQVKMVKDFWKFVEDNGAALPPPGRVRVSDYMQMQKKLLCSSQSRKYHHIPKVLHAIMEELLTVAHGELNGQTRLWIRSVLRCTSQGSREYLEKWPARLPLLTKMKAQEIDICISGILANRSETTDLGEKTAKINKAAFKMSNCKKFVRTHLRGNILLLLGTLDQLMNSFIKPIIPREHLIMGPERNSLHEDWQCFFRYILTTMASLSDGNYVNISKFITRWYLGTLTGVDDVVTALCDRLLKT
ncbi:unnamed protein product [Gongylonema pulchrum]|uniref:TYR_PHOSPHATASE_2 domain-containing protein n=1 Tax=Gongylonema pulchrum TaxID=637853 RepID=A0A183CVR0_9BILA|nr:unnamed protein product [Gongylonema pulchrum]